MLEQTTGSDRGRRTGVRRALRSRLGGWLALCDDTVVQIYGPYPPSRGRSRWRLQVYDPATRRKLSITAPSSLDAERLKVELEIELKRSKPLLVHEAIDQYLEVKRPDYRDPAEVENLGKILRQFVPDGPVLAVTAAKAERYYADEVGRPGRSGKARAAVTHQKRLALVKSFWAWLVRRGLASRRVLGPAGNRLDQPRGHFLSGRKAQRQPVLVGAFRPASSRRSHRRGFHLDRFVAQRGARRPDPVRLSFSGIAGPRRVVVGACLGFGSAQLVGVR